MTVVVEPGLRGRHERAKARGEGGRRGRIGKSAPKMSDLMVGDGPTVLDQRGKGEGAGSRKGSGLGQGAYDRLTFEDRVPLLPLFEALWAWLDTTIDYPQELLDSRIEGTVSLRFTVDSRGAIASDLQVVHSDSTVLEAYVLAIVASALERGFAGPRRAKRDRTPVHLVVHFRTSTDLRSQDKNRGGIEGNALTIRRSSWVPPIFDEVVNRVFTRYVPPIFPLPGGFYVDVIGLVHWLENLNQIDPDELKTVRLDGFRRKFPRAQKN